MIALHHNIHDRHEIEWLPPTDLQVKEAKVLAAFSAAQAEARYLDANRYEDAINRDGWYYR